MNGYAIEVIPRYGQAFSVRFDSRDEAAAELEAQCAKANRVWVGLYQVLDGLAILIGERDLWAEQEAARKAAA